MTNQSVNIMLVEDDDDDAFLFQEILQEIDYFQFNFYRAGSFEEAVLNIPDKQHDVYVLDYYLGSRTAMDLLEIFKSAGLTKPIIVLTGRQADQIDIELLKKGAADFLEKARLDEYVLERSIRYAIERTKVLSQLDQSRKKIQDLSLKVLRAEENQRRAIALEVHDSIGSNLAIIKYGLDKINREINHPDLARISAAVQDTIEETRHIHTALRPPILDELGIAMTVRWLCRKFQEQLRHIKMDTRIDVKNEQISDDLRVVIFRILQESLNNIAKHSQADHISVFLGERDLNFELVVEDNGRGFSGPPVCEHEICEKGTGLESMRERAELSGGSLTIDSEIGRGTRIRLTWPQNKITGTYP